MLIISMTNAKVLASFGETGTFVVGLSLKIGA